METLLKPGDMIRIRNDIEEGISYHMALDSSTENCWVRKEMAQPNEIVTITRIRDGQYKIITETDDSEFWDYTDQMFDPESIIMLLADRYNTNL